MMHHHKQALCWSRVQGSGQELFVSQLEDGRLNFQEVFLTGTDEPGQITPVIRGDFDEEPALFHVSEVHAIKSGNLLKHEATSKVVCTKISQNVISAIHSGNTQRAWQSETSVMHLQKLHVLPFELRQGVPTRF
jgi:hypothetical protein